jgi:salicylate hydroxylase
MAHPNSLSVAIVGGGIGGLATAISLRRAGHICTVYERGHYADEVGGAIATSANGSKWFKEWNVDTTVGRPVTLQGLIMRKWETGEEVKVVDLSGYEDHWNAVSLQ